MKTVISNLFIYIAIILIIAMMLFACIAFNLSLPYAAETTVSLFALSLFSFAVSLCLDK